MKLWSGWSLGNEDMMKGFVEELSYFEAGRWGMKLCSSVSLRNEGLVRWVAWE
jgi:hypothetical protein